MFLKHADQLVREGKFEDALKVISRAREADPENIYALAYEERVLSLLYDHRQRTLNPGLYPPGEQHLLPQVDEQIAGLSAGREHPGYSPPERLTEDMRERVAMMLSRAYELRNRGEFDGALDEVSRAFLIDSSSPELIRLERQLWNERNISVKRVRAKHNGCRPAVAALPESFTPGNGESEPHGDPAPPLRHMSTSAHVQPGEIKGVESDREIVRHLQRARDLLAAGQFDAALVAIEGVRRIRPDDVQATRIEQLIVSQQTESRVRRGTRDEVTAILTSANRLRSLHRYDEALREMERACILEPDNPSIQQCVAEIRQQKMTDRPLSGIAELLAQAENSRQCGDYASALNTLAEAYRISPDSKEVRKLELTIRREELLHHESG